VASSLSRLKKSGFLLRLQKTTYTSLFEELCSSKFSKGYKEVWDSPPSIGKNDVDDKK